MRVGPMELVIILVLVLIIFGPGKLPELAKEIDEAVQEVQEVKKDIKPF